jgi:MFS family permease
MPAFARHLTTSAPLIGLIVSIYSAGMLLPQAVFARMLAARPRKKPFSLAAHSGRLVFFLLSLALWAGLASRPSIMLALLIACVALWSLGEGAGSVGWLDIIGRAMPSKARARLYGLSHALGAVAGVGAGALITWTFSRPDIQFPLNYALIFGLAGLFMVLGTIGLMAMKEPAPPPGTLTQDRPRGRGTLRRVFADRRWRRMLACRLAVASMDLATPFYVGHAADVLRLPEASVGTFTIAMTMASVGASLLYSSVGARRGPHVVIRIAAIAAIVSPLYALSSHLTGSSLMATAYPIVFAALGVVRSAYLTGFGNYLLDLAPDGLHGAYIGLGNTFLSLTALAQLTGGWVLSATSYAALFGLTAAGVLVGIVLALRLPPARPLGAGPD